jgi:hypothetical protein
MRVFRKIILIAVVVLGLLLMAAVFLGKMFEDEITRYAVDGLNRQIRTELKVGEVKLSLIKKFPNASLEFRDVVMASVRDFQSNDFESKNTDTLLTAENLVLNFNLIKMLRRQYLVRELRVQSGKLNIYVDRNGEGNYYFWERKGPGTEKEFLVQLNNVKFSDILVAFDNRALQIDIAGLVRKSSVQGKFSADSFNLSAELEGVLHHYINKEILMLNEQKISSSAEMFVEPQFIRISEAGLMIAGQHLLLSGTILRPKPFDFDLAVQGQHLDLENLLRHLTISSRKIPDDLNAGGDLDFNGHIRGTVSNTKLPQIQASFSLQDGWLSSSHIPWEIRDFKTAGNYSNGNRQDPATTSVKLTGVSLRFGNSRLGGDYSVYNLIHPDFNYKIKTDLDLADIKDFIAIDTLVEAMSGRVLAEIQMKGDRAILDNLKKADLLNYDYQANIRLENTSLKLRNVPFDFRNFTGDMTFTDHLDIKNLNGVFEDSQVSMSGRVDNFLEFLFARDGNLWMDVDLYSERMDLNHLISKKSNETRTGNVNDTVFFPDRIFIKTRFWFDELEIKEFNATQVTGDLVYKPRRLNVNYLELLSMDGRIVSEGILEQTQENKFHVRSTSSITSVDISKAFKSFNDFGQDFIADRHLNGDLSGSVGFYAGLNERMRIEKETVLTDCDVIIRNGELSEFEPMMSLSRFIDVEELENVRFSTLDNEIYIRNQEVVIPNMDIHSSAFDIAASGLHGFDGNFTYKVKVALSELLANKSGKSGEKESEFGVIKDDGLGRVYVYLIIDGTPEGTDIKYDRRGAIQNVREQMALEKEELKQMLREEFGLFNKDTTLQGESTREGAPAFIIEWEEDSISTEEQLRNNNSEKERFIIEWDDDEELIRDTVPGTGKKRRKRKL